MAHFPGSPSKTRESLLPKLAVKPWVRASPPSLIIQNAQVVDPAAGSLLDGLQDVVVQRGMIVSVGPSGSNHTWTLAPEDGKPISVDVAGKYLCPGLIDCHVHITAVPGVQTMSELVQTPDESIALRATYVLREMLLRGFTTVRDTGGASTALANAIAEGLIAGPRLIQCGKALSQTVLKATREELKAGADFIKIMCGGGLASPMDAIETVQFTADEVRAITTTCKQMGNKHTTAHAYTDAAVLHAIENGVKGIEHGNLISRGTAELMAKEGLFLTPTLACYGIMVRPPFEDFLPPDGKIKNEQVMQRGLDALKIADEAGVTICYGSDLLTSMHALQTEEFTVRSSVLPSPKVLQHATTTAARMLDDPKLGRIASGCYADVLVLDANPLDDVTVLDYPEDHLFAVIQGGTIVYSRLKGLSATPPV